MKAPKPFPYRYLKSTATASHAFVLGGAGLRRTLDLSNMITPPKCSVPSVGHSLLFALRILFRRRRLEMIPHSVHCGFWRPIIQKAFIGEVSAVHELVTTDLSYRLASSGVLRDTRPTYTAASLNIELRDQTGHGLNAGRL